MKQSFYNKHTNDFFTGKQATCTAEQQNLGGDIIPAGSKVKILGKNRQRGGLNIESEFGIIIYGVSEAVIELES